MNLQSWRCQHVFVYIELSYWLLCISINFRNVGTNGWWLDIPTTFRNMKIIINGFLCQKASIHTKLCRRMKLFVLYTLSWQSTVSVLTTFQKWATLRFFIIILSQSKQLSCILISVIRALSGLCYTWCCHFIIVIRWSHWTCISTRRIWPIRSWVNISSILMIVVWLSCKVH